MRDIKIGRIAGIEVSLNWSVLLLCTYLVWTLAGEVFPSTNPHLSATAHLLMALAATAGVVMSLLLHELGHAVVARRQGMELDGITLWLFGGLARFKREFPNGTVELRVALAGPLVTLLLAVFFVLVALARPPQAVAGACAWLGYLNAVLFVFNMLPALPLDGGRILHALLWRRGHDDLWASRIAADVGRFFGLLFVAAGTSLLVARDAYTGFWLVITGWFLFSAAGGEAESAKRRRSGSAPSGGAAR
jgi:Zn-dependent protease